MLDGEKRNRKRTNRQESRVKVRAKQDRTTENGADRMTKGSINAEKRAKTQPEQMEEKKSGIPLWKHKQE